MRCKNCNAEVLDGELYCGECGAKVDFPSETNNNSKNEKKVMFSPITILLIIIVLVLIVVIFYINNKNNAPKSDVQSLYTPSQTVENSADSNQDSIIYSQTQSMDNSISLNDSTSSKENNSDYNTSIGNTSEESSTVNESEFKNDNQLAYTKYYLNFENGGIYENMYIEIEGNNIYLFNNDQEIYLTGTYTSNNGYLVGTYTEVRFNDGGDIETKKINDSFKFEIMPSHKLRDATGYGYWNNQILGTNNIYARY